jgi:hypothetical protein
MPCVGAFTKGNAMGPAGAMPRGVTTKAVDEESRLDAMTEDAMREKKFMVLILYSFVGKAMNEELLVLLAKSKDNILSCDDKHVRKARCRRKRSPEIFNELMSYIGTLILISVLAGDVLHNR